MCTYLKELLGILEPRKLVSTVCFVLRTGPLQHCMQYKTHRCQQIEADKGKVVIYDETWQLP